MDHIKLMAHAAATTWAIWSAWLTTALDSAKSGTVKPTRKLPKAKGNVALIPIHGMISQRGSIYDGFFGGTSTLAFEAAFARAMANPRIGAIVLDVDSPGGTTSGVQSAADRVYAARGQGKPIVAVANSMAASAAYWIASAADQFVASPGSDVGSIGVFRMHEDISGMMEQDGIKVTFFAKPPGKVAGNPFEPIDQKSAEHHMEQVAETYGEFAGAVSRHRPQLTASAITALDGGTFHPGEAKKRGLVDRVATMTQILSELGGADGGDEMATADLVDAWESCEIVEPRLRRKDIERRRLALDNR